VTAPVSDGAVSAATRALLAWYRPRRRAYPWRGAGPYAVLVSEVMLQQTQAARVAPCFERFVARFPDVATLAAAPRSEVVRAWAGLGYNRRAVALSEGARAIVRDHGGAVPSDPEALRRLPGVGPYTTAAVASLAFGSPTPAIDTNVRRVVARARLGVDPHAASAARIRDAAVAWIDHGDPGAWNQAVMDLGREVCRPRPRCGSCPLAPACRFRRDEVQPRPSRRRQDRFEGSSRQVRGSVVAVLRDRGSARLSTIVGRTGFAHERVAEAVTALHGDGLLVAGPAALAGRASGVVRLAT
jgi:A/G-specific adenine glycosylase